MVNYIQFQSAEGEILLEVDEGVVPTDEEVETGELNAGLMQRARDQTGQIVAVAQATFEDAVRKAVGLNVAAFLAAADALERLPTEMEITFGLKGTGELSNVAVGRLGGELNYQVKMVWRTEGQESLRSTAG